MAWCCRAVGYTLKISLRAMRKSPMSVDAVPFKPTLSSEPETVPPGHRHQQNLRFPPLFPQHSMVRARNPTNKTDIPADTSQAIQVPPSARCLFQGCRESRFTLIFCAKHSQCEIAGCARIRCLVDISQPFCKYHLVCSRAGCQEIPCLLSKRPFCRKHANYGMKSLIGDCNTLNTIDSTQRNIMLLFPLSVICEKHIHIGDDIYEMKFFIKIVEEMLATV